MVAVGTFKSSDFAFARLEDVDSAWFLPGPIVDHDVGAAFAVEARENELLRNNLLILLIDNWHECGRAETNGNEKIRAAVCYKNLWWPSH